MLNPETHSGKLRSSEIHKMILTKSCLQNHAVIMIRAALLLAAVVLAALAAPAAVDAPVPGAQARIDRHAVVTRHNVALTQADERSLLQVGNGEFAFGVDITGLQTLYGNTMSHWGWHSCPLPPGQRLEEFQLAEWDTYGRNVGYATSPQGQEILYQWLRENPHRINLGSISLRVEGKPIVLKNLTQTRQELDLWRGLITSRFKLAGELVQVETCCHPTRDLIAVRFSRPLAVALAFPYGSPGTSGADWQKPEAHQTTLALSNGRANFARRLDADSYAASLAWAGDGMLREEQPHTFLLTPVREFVCAFGTKPDLGALPTVTEVQAASAAHWEKFWNSGGAVDLSASTDPRWRELERRIVLSQYLEAIQAAGSLPPQESCLVNNGWNGKFHLEMHWWHGVHFAWWDRWPLFERSLGWYARILPVAREIAARQGYRGARWPKMVGPDGHDAPSGVGPLLIWQQPHPIYYAHLDHRQHPTRATLEQWREIVFATAEFMASYAVYDKAAGGYVLGPPLKTVPENTDPKRARNPAFELSYWRFGLRIAQQWREQLGLPREPEWDKVLRGLAPLPQQDGVYLLQEGMTDTFTKWNWEHPSLIGPLGMLPGDGVDPAVMKATVRKVWQTWQWDRKTWGWDFPMLAMGAARNGEPRIAVDALLHPAARNQFAANGFSAGGPYPYFPSNGGLLAAVALMAAGWDGGPEGSAPGFPNDGSWVVRWEGLKKAP